MRNYLFQKIQIINANELNTYLSNELDLDREHLVSLQQINGTISGENMFVIDKESAKNIAYKFGLEEDEINDDEMHDIVLEIQIFYLHLQLVN